MFNQENDNEADFCESYKSQVLGREEEYEEKSLFGTIAKLLTILILFVMIIGLSFYGYHYFSSNHNLKAPALPPASGQTAEKETVDDDLVVTYEAETVKNEKNSEVEPPKIESIEKVEEPNREQSIEKIEDETPTIVGEEDDLDAIANAIKIEIAKSEKRAIIAEKAIETEIAVETEKVSEVNSTKITTEAVIVSETEKSLEVPTISTSAPEAQYLEDLADLSREIERERKK